MLSVQVQKFGTSTRYGLKVLNQCGKRLKVRKFWVLILTFIAVTGRKLVRGVFLSPILNRGIGLKRDDD